jgi:hypothetical protein
MLGRTTGGMSLTLDRLEKAGLVRRLPDPDDRRRVVVEATEEGVALAKQVNAELHRWEDTLAADDAERDELAATLARLTDLIALAEHVADGGGRAAVARRAPDHPQHEVVGDADARGPDDPVEHAVDRDVEADDVPEQTVGAGKLVDGHYVVMPKRCRP